MEETGGPTRAEDGDGPEPREGVAVLDMSAIKDLWTLCSLRQTHHSDGLLRASDSDSDRRYTD